ncbi:hypothetical protein [Variovorax sp. KK3]|uniref:hypothetical protein n=1 Tax=Variovorax sp. KK3 TaxID=1855728 RepID=UPI00097C4CDB|nr:hypothetical protein [Variovorax sp. KK3]
MPLNYRPAAFAALVLVGASAFAQMPPPPPPLAPPGGPAPAEPVAAGEPSAATPVITGRIQRWLLNPNGEVDGLLLADGTQVAFPPHLSASVLQVLKPGDSVQVNGWRAANVPVVRAETLTATASNRSVIDQPPAIGTRPPPPRDPRALTAMSASGRVERVLYTDRGDANGVVLDSGTIVRFPPHVGMQLASTLQPGSTLHAKGWGSRGAQGSALEATALGATADGMRELFAGPGVEPPPPRRPHGPRMPRAERPLPPPPAS